MAKFTALEPPFEARRLLDAKKWVVVLTWGHSLGQRIDGLEFRSKLEAEGWISSNARSWLEVENLPQQLLHIVFKGELRVHERPILPNG